MIRDLATDALPERDHCDVLIVGAGPAGIVLALELAQRRSDRRIVLMEGGGLEPPGPAEKDLYRGDVVGKSYALAASRLRYVGGTTNHWGGWCRPLDEVDFRHKAHMPHSGWPFGLEELTPHYRVAHRWCEITSDEYDPDEVELPEGDHLLDLSSSSLFRNRLFRFSPPTRFGTRYADDLRGSANVDLVLHANAVGFERSQGQVVGIRARSLGGRGMTVTADRVVLAMGGLETARFALNHAEPRQGGIGLESPWVGRFFSDHVGLSPGFVLAPANLAYQRGEATDGPVMPVVAPTPEAIHDRQIQNVALRFLPVSDEQLLGRDYAANRFLGFDRGDHWLYRVQMILELSPNPDSRVLLGGDRDALGQRRLELHWRLMRSDYERARAAYRALMAELGRLGQARGRIMASDTEERLVSASGVFHHLGTLRMSTDPTEGVVAPDLRVHGERSLYVLGSATFPSFGFSNPTLTITALAVRLAEHLAGAEVRGE